MKIQQLIINILHPQFKTAQLLSDGNDFEGEKRNSRLAKHGRSKEKRSDAQLVVLALVVNIFGFVKFASIHEGNFSDTSDIASVLDERASCRPIQPFDGDH